MQALRRQKTHFKLVKNIEDEIQKQYKGYESQHQEYANHFKRQIQEKRRLFDERKNARQVSSSNCLVVVVGGGTFNAVCSFYMLLTRRGLGCGLKFYLCVNFTVVLT